MAESLVWDGERRDAPTADQANCCGKEKQRRSDVATRGTQETHGGFDNDEYTMNSVYRIIGDKPKRPFMLSDLQY